MSPDPSTTLALLVSEAAIVADNADVGSGAWEERTVGR